MINMKIDVLKRIP